VKVPEMPAAARAASPPLPSSVPSAGGGYVCASCGSPISVSEKYCGICGAVAVAARVPAPAAGAVPAASPVPAPVYEDLPPPESAVVAPVPSAAAPVVELPVCKACGNPIRPGDKYCSRCLVKVPEMPAAAPAMSPPLQSPAPAAVPAAPPAGKFCGSCGAAISTTTRFCGSCGAAVKTALPPGGESSSRPAPAAAAGREEVIGVIANARKVRFLGASWDTWNIVVTSRRMIMVQVTSAMITAAVAEAQAQARAEGKGFFGIMKDQMSAQFRYAVRYETMNPDMALAETPGNLAVENARITAIKLKLRDTGSGEVEYTEFKMVVESADGTFEYLMAEDDRYVNLLKQVFGDKVHMPFGYMKLGAARIKFF